MQDAAHRGPTQDSGARHATAALALATKHFHLLGEVLWRGLAQEWFPFSPTLLDYGA